MVKARRSSQLNSLRSLFSPNAVNARKKSFSPSNPSPTAAVAMEDDEMETVVHVVQMQKELSSLRERVKILNGGTGRNELLDKLKDSEVENKRTQEQLRSLNDKFHQVQKGLAEIDEERQKLRQAKGQLEKEKKDIQRQLDVREKEVLLLTRRCSTQTEKIRESSKLRASNNELASEMEGLRSNLTLCEGELSQIDSLRRQLKECQDSREELLKRLAKIKKDHDDVAGTLNSCFENIQKLNDSKAEVEEERRRDMQRAQIEIEKQRLAHLEATNELRTEVQLRQDQILQMEQILKDNMGTCTSLRNEKAELNRMQQEIFKLKEEQAAERTALIDENNQVVKSLHEEYAEMLSQLRIKLEEKESIVSSLEVEVSKSMHMMMGLATELQKVQEERCDETSRHADAMDKLDGERRELEDRLRARDCHVAELSESITTLQQEKNSLSTELSDARKRVKELEEENVFIMDLEDQLHEVNTSIVQVNEQRYLDSEEHEMTVALLQQELEDGRQMWSSMEQGLQEKILSLEEGKKLAQEASEWALSEARNVLQSLVDPSTSTEKALLISLEELNSEREARVSTERELNSLQEMLLESQIANANERANIDSLKAELTEARETSERIYRSNEERISTLRAEYECTRKLHEAEIESSKQMMEFKEQALSSVQTELRELHEAHQREVTCLQEMLQEERSQLSEARVALGKEATTSRGILSEKDATIAFITEEMASLKIETKELEIAMRDAGIRHEEALAIVKADLEASRLEHRRDVTEKERELKSKENALTALTAELEQLRLASDRETAAASQRLSKQTSLVSALKLELAESRAKAEEEAAVSRQMMITKDEVISSLKMELEDLKLVAQDNVTIARESLESKEKLLAAIQVKLEESRETSNQVMKSLKYTLAEREETISSLRVELENVCNNSNQTERTLNREVDEKDTALALVEKQLTKAREVAQKYHAASEATLKERNETIASVQTELSEVREALERKTVEFGEILATNEKSLAVAKSKLELVRSELDRTSSLAKETITQKDAVISSLRADLDDLRRATAAEKRTSRDALQVMEESFASLLSELTQVRLASERDISILNEDNLEKAETIKVLTTELEDLRRARESDASILQKRIDTKDDLLLRLKSDLDDVRISSDHDAKNFREQVARLKIELQRASTNLAIKEDEIRELKLIELKDAEETIASLESKLASARQSSSLNEVEAAETITQLQSQIAEQKTVNVHLDRKLSEMVQQRSKAMETLNNEMATLKLANEELESDLREQSAKLQERHATISVLTRKNTLLEQRERTLQSQLDNAAEDVRRAKEEQEKTLAALDREINRQRTNREDDDINFQKRCATLQKNLSDAEAKLLAQKEQTAEVERILEERTQLLGSMVTHNKETEDEKDSALARISVLEETTARLREEKEAIEHEFTQLRALQQKREDQLLEKIHDEQHLREVAEADLEAVRSRLSSIRRGSKDADELEKENMVLKDKVRRQEDYLKRKLQKDKALRERNSKNVTATPSRVIPSPKILGEHKARNIMATPSRSRIASPTKRRLVPSTIGGSTTKSLTTLSETSSFPDEWDANSQY